MKLGQKLKGIIGTVAPMLGGMIGGPLGGLAGKMVMDALGVNSEAAALQQLESNPDALLKLKSAEMNWAARMKELEIDEAKLHAEDTADARSLGEKLGTGFQRILSVIFLIGYFGLMYLLFTSEFVGGLDDWSKGQLGILIGVLTAAVTQIIVYWFGSSSGSKDKTAALLNGVAK